MKSTIKLSFVHDDKPTDIVSNEPDYEIEIECEVEGPFAIHRAIRGGGSATAPYATLNHFIVTHIPTGCHISYGNKVLFHTEERAQIFVRRLLPLAQWDKITKESIRANPLRWRDLGRKVKAVYESLNWITHSGPVH